MFRPSRGRGFPGGGGSRISFPLLLLFMQMANVGFSIIPPVTLVFMLGQIAAFLQPYSLGIPRIHNACISAINVYYRHDWKRLLYASFLHGSDMHLYYNMVSFMWKGMTLERRLGGKYFAYMILVFTAMTEIVMVGLAMLADEILHDSSYLHECAVGFSGVLFALKVVTTHMMPAGFQYVLGFIPVHSRFACWAELLIIQLLVPNASFIGHLAGILVGLAYVKGPLKSIMDIFIPTEPRYTYTRSTSGGTRPSYTYSSGRTSGGMGGGYGGMGGSAANNNLGGGGAASRYEAYTGGMSEEEQLAQAMQDSRQTTWIYVPLHRMLMCLFIHQSTQTLRNLSSNKTPGCLLCHMTALTYICRKWNT